MFAGKAHKSARSEAYFWVRATQHTDFYKVVIIVMNLLAGNGFPEAVFGPDGLAIRCFSVGFPFIGYLKTV